MAQQQSSLPLRSIQLSDGQEVPTIGLGTYALTESHEPIHQAIVTSGYRFLDCATMYKNEELVGRAITQAIEEGVVTRDDLYIVTKLWVSDFKDPEAALRTSLAKLNVTSVNCYLIHWPAGFFDPDPANRVPVHQLWAKMEALVDQGLTKSIGVSNFNLQLLADLLCYARIKPVFNEIELNPTCTQTELLRFHRAQGIVPIAYTPVCRLGQVENAQLENDGGLEAICSRHGKSKAQVMLNWAVARGTIPIPRSGSLPHIQENSEIYDFELSQEEMATIDGLNQDLRICDKRGFTGDFNFFV